jgi:hypothetical protein
VSPHLVLNSACNSVQKLGTVGTITPGLIVVSMRACAELANSFTAAGIEVEVDC